MMFEGILHLFFGLCRHILFVYYEVCKPVLIVLVCKDILIGLLCWLTYAIWKLCLRDALLHFKQSLMIIKLFSEVAKGLCCVWYHLLEMVYVFGSAFCSF